MASPTNEKSTLTLARVTAWREELFHHRSLRTTVEALSDWPLSQYLSAAVLQAAHLKATNATAGLANTSLGSSPKSSDQLEDSQHSRSV
jgi:hypothetical protein